MSGAIDSPGGTGSQDEVARKVGAASVMQICLRAEESFHKMADKLKTGALRKKVVRAE